MLTLMKTKSLFLILVMALFVIGCSSDDDNLGTGDDHTDNPDDQNGDGDGDGDDSTTFNYFPTAEGNSWTYSNHFVSEEQMIDNTATEVLTVDTVNGNVTTFNTSVNGDAPGFFTGALANGSLTKDGAKLLFEGEFSVMDIEGFDISVPIEETIIYDLGASEGDVLYEGPGEFSDEIPFGGLGNYPLTLTYTVSVVQGESFDEMLGFEDVKSSKIIISNLSAVLSGVPVVGSIELMETTVNEVVLFTNYFAKNVGLIQSTANIDLPLVDLDDIMPLPLPGMPELGHMTSTSTQDLIEYEVN